MSIPYRPVSIPPLPSVIDGNRARRRLLTAIWVVVALAISSAVATPIGFFKLVSYGAEWQLQFKENKTFLFVVAIEIVAAITILSYLLAAFLISRPKASLLWVRHLLVTGYVLVGIQLILVVRIIALIAEKFLSIKIGEADDIFNPYVLYGRIIWNQIGIASAVLLAVTVIVAHLISVRRSTTKAFAPEQKRLRVDNHDEAYNANIDTSIALHVLIVLIIPLALQLPGCALNKDFSPPGGGGGGGPQQVVVKILKQKKQPKRRKYVFRPNSVISFHTPTIDDSKVVMEVDQETLNQYQHSNPGGAAGEGFGSGGGKGGGWAGGKAGAAIHFVRLQYDGLKWDDGMDATERADANFLEELHRVSKLKTEGMGEAIKAGQLRSLKKGTQPPFLFMTGKGAINMSDAETRVIRQYLDAGGMLFADCGSPQWHSAFLAWVRRLYPDHPLLDISNDDAIFSWYYPFPNGAPPLWHHGGSRALGVKSDGRLTVFYFPGNILDAWKTGHGGVDNHAVDQAYQLGINIVKYSFDNYMATNYPPSKK